MPEPDHCGASRQVLQDDGEVGEIDQALEVKKRKPNGPKLISCQLVAVVLAWSAADVMTGSATSMSSKALKDETRIVCLTID